MKKYNIYQLNHKDSSIKEEVITAWREMQFAFSAEKLPEIAGKAFQNDLYVSRGTITANDLDDVFKVGNAVEEKHPPFQGYSVSVGDIICDPDGKSYVVAHIGFKELDPDVLESSPPSFKI